MLFHGKIMFSSFPLIFAFHHHSYNVIQRCPHFSLAPSFYLPCISYIPKTYVLLCFSSGSTKNYYFCCCPFYEYPTRKDHIVIVRNCVTELSTPIFHVGHDGYGKANKKFAIDKYLINIVHKPTVCINREFLLRGCIFDNQCL